MLRSPKTTTYRKLSLTLKLKNLPQKRHHLRQLKRSRKSLIKNPSLPLRNGKSLWSLNQRQKSVTDLWVSRICPIKCISKSCSMWKMKKNSYFSDFPWKWFWQKLIFSTTLKSTYWEWKTEKFSNVHTVSRKCIERLQTIFIRIHLWPMKWSSLSARHIHGVFEK